MDRKPIHIHSKLLLVIYATKCTNYVITHLLLYNINKLCGLKYLYFYLWFSPWNNDRCCECNFIFGACSRLLLMGNLYRGQGLCGPRIKTTCFEI